MIAKTGIVLRVLCNRYHQGSVEEALQPLPSEERAQVQEQLVDSRDLSPLVSGPAALLAEVHYSWLEPSLRAFSEEMQALMLAALSETQRRGLQRLTGIEATPKALSALARTFLLELLGRAYVGDATHLPLAYLPTSRLDCLFGLSKTQLVELLDFLGIRDLGEEIRHVVDRRKLAKIFSVLSPHQQQYLKVCMQSKEKLKGTPLELDKWEGDVQKLMAQLHRRGLFRLALALAGELPDRVWHLSQRFDIGRGRLLLRHSPPQPQPPLTDVMASQVVECCRFLGIGT